MYLFQVMEAFYPVPLSQKFCCDEAVDEHLGRYFGNPNDVSSTTVTEEEAKAAEERKSRQERRRHRLRVATGILEDKKLDSLLIAVKWTRPLPILEELLKSLRPSSPVVLFSPIVEVVDFREFSFIGSQTRFKNRGSNSRISQHKS